MTSERPGGPVVVTGGAGAIGQVLVGALTDSGSEVRVIDNLSSGRRESLAPLIGSGRVSLTVADLRNAGSFEGAFGGARELWHLAANPDIRRGTADPTLDLEHGTLATFRALEAARRSDVPSVRFSSSSVVYGFPTIFPTPESYGPLVPESLYAASKLASEGLVSAYAHCYGMHSVIYRFANIVGPGMSHGIIFDFFAKLAKEPDRLEVLGDGRQSKSYLRTEECVAAMRFAAERSRGTVGIFNIGTTDQISAREIAELVVARSGGRARIECTGGERGWTGDVPRQLLDVTKLAELGWRPRLSSRAAVEATIDEFARARGLP